MKKQTQFLVILAIIVVIGLSITATMNMSELSVISGGSDTEIKKDCSYVVYQSPTGETFSSYEELNQYIGEYMSDTEYQREGIIEEDNQIKVLACGDVI
jgi:hypothetical protein